MNKALIFDLDGTLWNTNPACCKALNRALKDLNENIKISVKMIDSVTGKPMEQGLKELIPQIFNKYGNIKSVVIKYEKKIIPESRPIIYRGVKKGLKKLSAFYSLFIISNCEEWYLKHFLKYSGLENLITDYDCAGKSKQSKESMIKNMIKKYNLVQTVYIGDIQSDMAAAENAGADFIQMTYGFDKPIKEAIRFNSIDKLVKSLT
jgi:phosphoglycolate phosphatase